jgi:hypothetical protein
MLRDARVRSNVSIAAPMLVADAEVAVSRVASSSCGNCTFGREINELTDVGTNDAKISTNSNRIASIVELIRRQVVLIKQHKWVEC